MDIVSIAIGVVVKNDVKVTGVVEVWTTVGVSTLVEVWCDFEVTLATSFFYRRSDSLVYRRPIYVCR